MQDYLRLIDTHTQGPRNDVTPLFADYAAFAALVADLSHPFTAAEFDVVAGIDALGFILGAAMALHFKKGFIPIRKGGRLPVKVDRVEFTDYTGRIKSLELRANALDPQSRVLIVDEWIETGAQVGAAVELVERQGGIVAGIVTINVDDSAATRALCQRYRVHTLWQGGQLITPATTTPS